MNKNMISQTFQVKATAVLIWSVGLRQFHCGKIRRESTPAMIVLFFVILGGQFVICQYGSYMFVVCQKGLSAAIGASVFIVNAILKCLPDWIAPSLGNDTVFNRRYPNRATKVDEE